MSLVIQPEVEARVRRVIPKRAGVLPGSLPVVSFGDPGTAAVATVSLNPSSREFLTEAGEWLPDAKRRLASLRALGVDDPGELDAGQVEQVVAESYGYFRSGRWYRQWFGWLEGLLTSSGAGSYLEGSACHLDLVQWATVQPQGQLPAPAWQQLVQEDREFLRWQLAHANVSVVLVNGASVIVGRLAAGVVSDLAEDRLEYPARGGTGYLRVFRGASDGVRFLGWNRPLAGALPRTARHALAGWVAAALRPPAGATASWQAARTLAGPGPDGLIPPGAVVNSADELEHLLRSWLRVSRQPTIGDIGRFGGSPLIKVTADGREFVLNRDTKRSAVANFAEAAATAGGAGNLPWHLAPNARGHRNRVSYLPDDSPTPPAGTPARVTRAWPSRSHQKRSRTAVRRVHRADVGRDVGQSDLGILSGKGGRGCRLLRWRRLGRYSQDRRL
jgi:hypothetical protein